MDPPQLIYLRNGNLATSTKNVDTNHQNAYSCCSPLIFISNAKNLAKFRRFRF